MHVDSPLDVGLYLIEEKARRPHFPEPGWERRMNGAPLAIGWRLGATVSVWIHPDQSF